MSPTTRNTGNIIALNISNSVLQITQSGKDTISKETAQKLEQVVKSDEIKGLRENDRMDVLDQVDDIVKELNSASTDKGKVHRGLKRLVKLMPSAEAKTMVAHAAIAYATARLRSYKPRGTYDHARLYDMDLPRPPAGVPVPRFLRINYVQAGTGVQIHASIVLDRMDQMYNATNNAIMGGYPAGIIINN